MGHKRTRENLLLLCPGLFFSGSIWNTRLDGNINVIAEVNKESEQHACLHIHKYTDAHKNMQHTLHCTVDEGKWMKVTVKDINENQIHKALPLVCSAMPNSILFYLCGSVVSFLPVLFCPVLAFSFLICAALFCPFFRSILLCCETHTQTALTVCLSTDLDMGLSHFWMRQHQWIIKSKCQLFGLKVSEGNCSIKAPSYSAVMSYLRQ